MVDVAIKAQTINDFQAKPGDTGSTEVQVALLTRRITRLTDHMKANKKDNHTRHGLLKMVSRRGRLLKYLRAQSVERYKNTISRLNLRDKF